MKKKYKNTHCEAIHSMASGLRKIGLMSEDDMRFYDDGCLAKPTPEAERAASQKPQGGMRPSARGK
jgi:DNA-binding transcriptional regulator YiaG